MTRLCGKRIQQYATIGKEQQTEIATAESIDGEKHSIHDESSKNGRALWRRKLETIKDSENKHQWWKGTWAGMKKVNNDTGPT